MSADNPADVIHEGYVRFNRGELEWLVDQMHPEIVWQDSSRMPDAVRRFLSSFQRHWDEFRWEPEAVIASPAGDRVLGLVRLIARGRASGATVDAEIAHVYDLEGGKVLRVRTFFDRDLARREAGIDP
jgi:ketosteroid isomerase-like protein